MANDDDPADLLPGSNDTRTRQERLQAAAEQIVRQRRVRAVMDAYHKAVESRDKTPKKPEP